MMMLQCFGQPTFTAELAHVAHLEVWISGSIHVLLYTKHATHPDALVDMFLY